MSIVVAIVGHLLWLTTMASTGIAEIVKKKYWLYFIASFFGGSAVKRKLFTIIHVYFYVYVPTYCYWNLDNGMISSFDVWKSVVKRVG